jgi:hypothetical protein
MDDLKKRIFYLASEESVLEVDKKDLAGTPDFCEIIAEESASALRLLRLLSMLLRLSMYPGVVLCDDAGHQYFEK